MKRKSMSERGMECENESESKRERERESESEKERERENERVSRSANKNCSTNKNLKNVHLEHSQFPMYLPGPIFRARSPFTLLSSTS